MKLQTPITILFMISILFTNCKEKNNLPAENKPQKETSSKTAPEPSAQAQSEQDPLILEIRKNFQSIEKASLQEKKIPLKCDMGESSLSLFYNQQKLAKIIYTTGSDHSYEKQSYYIWQDRLFFTFIEGGGWRFVAENKTIDDAYEKRFYFHDNQPIHCLEKKVSGQKDLKNRLNKQENLKIKNCNLQSEKIKSLLQTLKTIRAGKDYQQLCL